MRPKNLKMSFLRFHKPILSFLKRMRLNTDENCTSITQQGRCEQCKPGYSISNEVCAAVETLIDNCEIYNEDKTCKFCVTDFYLLNQNCVAVSISIQNCRRYGSKGEACDQCAPGFFMYIDKRYCLSL